MSAVADVLNSAATRIEHSDWNTTTTTIVIGWSTVPGNTKAEVVSALRAAAVSAS